jgi:hypothetical protein
MPRPLLTLRSTARPVVIAVIAVCLMCSFGLGQQPITYTGFMITDGQLGSWQFHNARIVLTFRSNTSFVQKINPACVMGQNVVYNPTGVATITIADHERVVTARLARHQIFVSFDQDAGGVGFGSYAPGGVFVNDATCANAAGLTPTYPLGLHHGTMDNAGCSGCTGTSPNQNAFPDNLQGTVGFSGKGYTCNGVPQSTVCQPPTWALKTDHGDLYLAEPYQEDDIFWGESLSLNGGFFFQEPGYFNFPLPPSVLAPSSSVPTGSITYHMLLVSDVSLNGHLYQNASVHLTLRSDVSRVTPMPNGDPFASMNSSGVARVDITSGGRTVSARFDPGQLYVYFDPATGAGFGSTTGGQAYPAVLAPTYIHVDTELFAGVANILIGSTANNSGAASGYSGPTYDLANTIDLKQETLLADYVSSCTDFNFVNGQCDNLPSSRKLTTNNGDFYLYEVYNSSSQLFNDVKSSNSWGVFWTTFVAEESGD